MVGTYRLNNSHPKATVTYILIIFIRKAIQNFAISNTPFYMFFGSQIRFKFNLIEGEPKLSGLVFCFIPQKPLLLDSKVNLEVKANGQEL